VHGRHDEGSQRRLDEQATILGDAERPAQERLRRGRAEAHQHRRSHLVELGVEPRPARQLLAQVGFPVDPALASWCCLPPEVRDHVGHVDVGTIDTRFPQRAIEDPAGRPDEVVTSTSSRSPGCSPVSIARECAEPSPKTACVA